MDSSCHKCEELQKTIQLQHDHIQQLTQYNAQFLEDGQEQNKQKERLSRQLAEAHNQYQRLLHQLQQLQVSRDDVTKQQHFTHVLHNGSAHDSTNDAERLIAQLETELDEVRSKLDYSERQRQLADEQTEKSRHAYESEISWLKLQLSTFEEDFKAERRAHEATSSELGQVRVELDAARRQLNQYSLQQMQDLRQRREAALERHRRDYERTHSYHYQYQQQRPIYQADSPYQLRPDDSDEDGEDEID